MLMDSAAHSAGEVAERLLLSASTVRHYRAARKLYSCPANGRLVFPDWQFNQAGDKAIPSLEDVLAVLPKDLHPQSVAGFFLTPQPDLGPARQPSLRERVARSRRVRRKHCRAGR